MTADSPTPPVADDDFPEFSEPPRHKPRAVPPRERAAEKAPAGDQDQVDHVIARLRRERAQRKT